MICEHCGAKKEPGEMPYCDECVAAGLLDKDIRDELEDDVCSECGALLADGEMDGRKLCAECRDAEFGLDDSCDECGMQKPADGKPLCEACKRNKAGG